MNTVCIIPSRLHSTRLPRKPLLPIQGKPMIQWTYENAHACRQLNKVVVATDAPEIAAVIQALNGETVLDDSPFTTGSQRVASASRSYPEADIIINLQGDEPFIKPNMLMQLITAFDDDTVQMATLAYPLAASKYTSPASVKVITNLKNDALYFSRAPIPYHREKVDKIPVYNHMGVYAFRRDFLSIYAALPQTPLDACESLEQLRVLEHGYAIRVCVCLDATLEINTPEEYEEAQAFCYT